MIPWHFCDSKTISWRTTTNCAPPVRQSGEPVYIENEDGEADMVLLSAREYHRLTQQSALQQFFAAAAQDGAAGRRPEEDVLAELQKQEDEEGG